jgi:hypothetical protein
MIPAGLWHPDRPDTVAGGLPFATRKLDDDKGGPGRLAAHENDRSQRVPTRCIRKPADVRLIAGGERLLTCQIGRSAELSNISRVSPTGSCWWPAFRTASYLLAPFVYLP